MYPQLCVFTVYGLGYMGAGCIMSRVSLVPKPETADLGVCVCVLARARMLRASGV